MVSLYDKKTEIQQDLSFLVRAAQEDPTKAIGIIHRITQEAKTHDTLADTFIYHGGKALKEMASYNGIISIVLLESMLTVAAKDKGLTFQTLNAACDILPIALKKWHDENAVVLLHDILTAAGEDFSKPHIYRETFFTGPDNNGNQSVYYRAVPDGPIHYVVGKIEKGALGNEFKRSQLSTEAGSTHGIKETLDNPIIAHPIQNTVILNFRHD